MSGKGQKKRGFGVGIMLLQDGMVLLGQRHHDPDKADSELRGEGTWTLPGGKVDEDEDFEQTAARELFEETGIRVSEGDLEVFCVSNDKNEHAHFVTIGLKTDKFSGQAQVKEPDEITQWKWFSLDELPTPLFFPSERVITCYKNNTFYIRW